MHVASPTRTQTAMSAAVMPVTRLRAWDCGPDRVVSDTAVVLLVAGGMSADGNGGEEPWSTVVKEYGRGVPSTAADVDVMAVELSANWR